MRKLSYEEVNTTMIAQNLNWEQATKFLQSAYVPEEDGLELGGGRDTNTDKFIAGLSNKGEQTK